MNKMTKRCILILLSVIACVLVVDLLHATPNNTELRQVVVDVSQELPEIHVEFSLEIDSRFSHVQLGDEASCKLKSAGTIHLQITTNNNHVVVDATIPPEDAESHAMFLRQFLLENNQNSKSLEFSCSVGVVVRLGHVIPFEHFVTLTQDDILKAEGSTLVSDKSGSSDSTTKNVEPLPPFVVTKTDDGALQLDSRLPWQYDTKFIDLVYWIVPPIVVSTKTCGARTARAQFAGLDKVRMDQLDYVRVLLGCTTTNGSGPSSCKWYNPIVDIVTGGTCSLLISIEAQGSFLEHLLGSFHQIDVIKEQQHLTHPSKRRRRMIEGFQSRGSLAADCIRLSAEKLDAEICTAMLLKEGLLEATGLMEFYSFSFRAESDVTWGRLSQASGIEVDASAMGDINGDEQFKSVGSMVVNADELSLNLSFSNEMESWPIRFSLLSHAALGEEDFSLLVDEAVLQVKNDFLVNSTGSVQLNLGDEQSFTASILDPSLRLEAQVLLQNETGMTGQANLTFNGEPLTFTEIDIRLDSTDAGPRFVGEIKDDEVQDYVLSTVLQTNLTNDDIVHFTLDRFSFRMAQESYVDTKAQFEIHLVQKALMISIIDNTALLETALKAKLVGKALSGYFFIDIDGKNITYAEIDASVERGDENFTMSGVVQDSRIQDYALSGKTSMSWAESVSATFSSLLQVDQQKYLDTNALFALDFDNSTYVWFIEDISDGVDYFYTGLRGNWISTNDAIGSRFDELALAVASDTFFNLTGDVLLSGSESGEELSVALDIDSDSNADFQIDTTFNATWDMEKQVLRTDFWQMDVATLGKPRMAALGNLSLSIPDWTASISIVDEPESDGIGIVLAMSLSWPNEIITSTARMVRVFDGTTSMSASGNMTMDLSDKFMSFDMVEYESDFRAALGKGSIAFGRDLVGSPKTFMLNVDEAALTISGDRIWNGKTDFLIDMD